MKVDVLYLKSGKTVSMEKRYADILSKLGHVLIVEPAHVSSQPEIVVSDEADSEPKKRGRKPKVQE